MNYKTCADGCMEAWTEYLVTNRCSCNYITSKEHKRKMQDFRRAMCGKLNICAYMCMCVYKCLCVCVLVCQNLCLIKMNSTAVTPTKILIIIAAAMNSQLKQIHAACERALWSWKVTSGKSYFFKLIFFFII